MAPSAPVQVVPTIPSATSCLDRNNAWNITPGGAIIYFTLGAPALRFEMSSASPFLSCHQSMLTAFAIFLSQWDSGQWGRLNTRPPGPLHSVKPLGGLYADGVATFGQPANLRRSP